MKKLSADQNLKLHIPLRRRMETRETDLIPFHSKVRSALYGEKSLSYRLFSNIIWPTFDNPWAIEEVYGENNN